MKLEDHIRHIDELVGFMDVNEFVDYRDELKALKSFLQRI